jgi:methionyl-tRNA formyltransferase
MKIVFMGTPQAAVPSLARLISDGHEIVAVYTQPDRPAGRGQNLHLSPIKEFSLERGLPVYQPTKLRIPETIEIFSGHAADTAIVVAYGRILSADYLNAFPNGSINLHFSLLPKYRGAAPVNWAIAEGENETGVTTMRMDEGLDTGDILLQNRVEIGITENAIDLMSLLADIGADTLSETLTNLSSIHPQKQQNSLATFAPILKKEDGRIDWNTDAGKITNRIRGFQPFPGTFTEFRGKNLKVWEARSLQGPVECQNPGEILATGAEGVIVCCGRDVLKLLEVQPEGKKRMQVVDFVNGFRPVKGEVFGQ